jgi:hypothetical protein
MSHIATLPTASEVRIESKLRPEQTDATLASVNAFESYISGLINEQVNVVESYLVAASKPYQWPFTDANILTANPDYDTAEITALQERQQLNATLIVKYFTLSQLYLISGQLNDAYLERSREYKSRGKQLLELLISEVNGISTNQLPIISAYGATLTTGRGDYTPVDTDEVGWIPV